MLLYTIYLYNHLFFKKGKKLFHCAILSAVDRMRKDLSEILNSKKKKDTTAVSNQRVVKVQRATRDEDG